MSLFDVVKSWFSGSGSGRLYIIDGAQVAGPGSSVDRLSPRDQVHVLQQLARFAEKEKISIQVAFEGRALREVEHGGEFQGVQVFFADKQAALQDLILDLVRSGSRRQVVLVTGHRQLEEKAAAAGAQTLRPSTLRKAMENGGGGDRGDRGGDRGDYRGERGDRGRRGGRRRGGRGRGGRDGDGGGAYSPSEQHQQPTVQQDQAAPAAAPGADAPAPAPAPAPDPSKDAVRDLIDLVE